MKKLLVCCLLVVVSCLSLAQQSRQEKLQQLKTRDDIKVTEVENDVLKLEYRNGKVHYQNIGNYKAPTNHGLQKTNYSPNYDSTIIDITTIDTTLYYQKYKYWQEVPISNLDMDHILIGDVNKNGRPELYAARKFYYKEQEPVAVYELNNSGKFQFVYQYDSVLISENIYDIDKDGKEEVQLNMAAGIWGVEPSQRFFSKPTDNSLATRLDFQFIPYDSSYQMNDVTLGEYDGDQKTDLLFAGGAGKGSMHIFEYNSVTKTFDSVYRFQTVESGQHDVSGFSTGDFDLDGKMDIVFGTGSGAVHVIENEGDNQFTHSWQGVVETYGAYTHTWTHDIDRNGKPEFWVLGNAFYDDGAKTRITLFETNGDNSYEAVGKIDLIGTLAWYAATMQAVDIDKDGIDEVAICIDDNFLILNFNGSQTHQTYEVYYIKRDGNHPSDEYDSYYGATMSDLQNNGNYEILISMLHIKYNINPFLSTNQLATVIFKPDTTISIIELGNQFQYTFNLQQNYPNPFNPTTSISYTIKEMGLVTLKIFDVLGREVSVLVNEIKEPGKYSINFDASKLSSGVYIYLLNAGNFTSSKKMILTK